MASRLDESPGSVGWRTLASVVEQRSQSFANEMNPREVELIILPAFFRFSLSCAVCLAPLKPIKSRPKSLPSEHLSHERTTESLKLNGWIHQTGSHGNNTIVFSLFRLTTAAAQHAACLCGSPELDGRVPTGGGRHSGVDRCSIFLSHDPHTIVLHVQPLGQRHDGARLQQVRDQLVVGVHHGVQRLGCCVHR